MKDDKRTSLAAPCGGEVEEKKSRFLSFCAPISDEATALDLVASIKKEHYSARHVAFAYILPDGSARSSDAGEPSGSAGSPMLDVLRGIGTDDAPMRGIIAIVVRYFGGTLLGVGGLVRAYGGAVANALTHGVRAVSERRIALKLTCTYAEYGAIEQAARHEGVLLANADFTDAVALRALVLPEKCEWFKAFLSELSNGRIFAKEDGEEWTETNYPFG